jgi:large subunit ribosomal protein L23
MAQERVKRQLDPYNILLHPCVTEKTMAVMDKHNALEFYVRRDANKTQVKAAFKQIFDVDVKAVNTRVTKHGKRALIYFPADTSAEEIGMRIGVF